MHSHRTVGRVLPSVVALLFWGMGPPACSAELKGLKMNGVLAYAPDGDHVIVATEANSLQLVELPTHRVVWDHPLPEGDAMPAQMVRYAARAGLIVVVQQSTMGLGPGRYATMDAGSGRATGGVRDAPSMMASRKNPDRVAVSDDGRILVTALESKGVYLFEQPGGRLLHTIRSGHLFDFQAGAQVLAAQVGNERENRTLVLRPAAGPDGAWTEAAVFPGSFTHAWAGARLAVAPPQGLQVWDGHGVRTVTTWQGEPGKLFGLGATGDLVAAATDVRLDVYDVARGTLVLSKSNLGKVWGVALRGDLLVVVVERKDWKMFALEINLRSGAVRKEKALGAYQDVKWWTIPEVARQQTVFLPALLPQGKYVDLSLDEQHNLVRIAD